jgi:hypothetical protein
MTINMFDKLDKMEKEGIISLVPLFAYCGFDRETEARGICLEDCDMIYSIKENKFVKVR